MTGFEEMGIKRYDSPLSRPKYCDISTEVKSIYMCLITALLFEHISDASSVALSPYGNGHTGEAFVIHFLQRNGSLLSELDDASQSFPIIFVRCVYKEALPKGVDVLVPKGPFEQSKAITKQFVRILKNNSRLISEPLRLKLERNLPPKLKSAPKSFTSFLKPLKQEGDEIG